MAFDLEQFPTSESAKRMIASVSEEFYEKSYVGKWLYQVMGLEWDAIRLIVESLPEQAFPETATWGLMYHEMKWGLPIRENLALDERRRLIYRKRDLRAPMNPWRLEWYLNSYTGYDFHIEDVHEPHLYGWEPPHPNVFKVYIFAGDETVNVKSVQTRLNELRQSHTTYTLQERINMVIDQSDLEHIDAFRMLLRIPIYFWGPLVLLDGSALLDGSQLLYSARRYNLIPGIIYRFVVPAVHEVITDPRLVFRTSAEVTEHIAAAAGLGPILTDFWGRDTLNGAALLDGSMLLDGSFRYDLIPGFKFIAGGPESPERFILPQTRLHITIPERMDVHGGTIFSGWAALWNRLLLDGSILLNGSRMLDGARRSGNAGATVRCALPKVEEKTDHATLTTSTKDYAFLDSSLALDGSRRLNSIYRKEDL